MLNETPESRIQLRTLKRIVCGFGCLLVSGVVVFATSLQTVPVNSDSIKIRFEGGAGRVSGSMSILSFDGEQWMVDCGAFYPEIGSTVDERQRMADEKTAEISDDLMEVKAILLTHAHLDHIGRLPLLVREGYSGPVYATEPTIALSKTMLRMQIRYESSRKRDWVWSKGSYEKGYIKAHWNDECKWLNRIRSLNKKKYRGTIANLELHLSSNDIDVSPCKVCAELELDPVMTLMREIELESPQLLSDSVSVKAINAGHIPGSCSLLFELKQEGKKIRKVLFSGDLGSPYSTIIEGPPIVEGCDIIISECTYGCTPTTKDPEIELLHFRRSVSEVINEGGVAWIPAFALDRSQKVLHQIRQLQKTRMIGNHVPIFMPSPTAKSVSDTYRDGRLKGWFRASWENDVSNLFPPGLQTDWIDIEEDELPIPSILITTSGMMDRAFSESLLDKLLPSAEVTVFLVGYQDPFSPGGILQAMSSDHRGIGATRDLSKDHQEIEVNANIEKFTGFSSHAKADDIDRWLQNQDKELASLILVHGEQSRLEERDACLQQQGWKNVHIAREGAAISFNYDD